MTAAMGPQTTAQDPRRASTAQYACVTGHRLPSVLPLPTLLSLSLLLEGQEQPWVQDIFLWLPAVVSGKAKSRSQ